MCILMSKLILVYAQNAFLNKLGILHIYLSENEILTDHINSIPKVIFLNCVVPVQRKALSEKAIACEIVWIKG